MGNKTICTMYKHKFQKERERMGVWGPIDCFGFNFLMLSNKWRGMNASTCQWLTTGPFCFISLSTLYGRLFLTIISHSHLTILNLFMMRKEETTRENLTPRKFQYIQVQINKTFNSRCPKNWHKLLKKKEQS